MLLRLLVETFVPEGDPFVVGIDETLERRYRRSLPGASTVIRSVYPRYLREEQRPQMGVCDVVGGGPLGFWDLGLAFPLSPGSFRALCCPAG